MPLRSLLSIILSTSREVDSTWPTSISSGSSKPTAAGKWLPSTATPKVASRGARAHYRPDRVARAGKTLPRSRGQHPPRTLLKHSAANSSSWTPNETTSNSRASRKKIKPSRSSVSPARRKTPGLEEGNQVRLTFYAKARRSKSRIRDEAKRASGSYSGIELT